MVNIVDLVIVSFILFLQKYWSVLVLYADTVSNFFISTLGILGIVLPTTIKPLMNLGIILITSGLMAKFAVKQIKYIMLFVTVLVILSFIGLF